MPASLNLGDANSSVMGLPIGALCCASSCKEETTKTGFTGICHLAVPNNKRGQCRCLTAACLSFTLGGSGSGGGRGCGCGYGVECVVDQHHCPTLPTPKPPPAAKLAYSPSTPNMVDRHWPKAGDIKSKNFLFRQMSKLVNRMNFQ